LILIKYKIITEAKGLHRWCIGYPARSEWCISWFRAPVGSNERLL